MYLSLQHALTGTEAGGSTLANLLPFLLLAVAFWFLLIRPQRKRAQEAAQIRASLRPGSEVITTAGLYATVAHVDDDAVLLEVAPGVTNRYAKGAVARILTPAEAESDLLEERSGSERVDDSLADDGLADDRLGDETYRDDRPGRDEGPAAGR